MKTNFKPHIEKMRRYQTSLGRDLENGVRLDRNEKVSNMSPAVMRDIFELFTTYSLSASPESLSLYEKIARSVGVPIECVFILNGITEGIRVLYDFCTSPGDNVICLDPTYPMYWIYADMYQVEYRKFIYDTKTLQPDLSTFYNQLDEKTRFVFLPNPNLPIESCFDLKELDQMAIACKEKNVTLIIDEAYHFFGAPSAIDLVSKHDNVLIFRTFSKAYGLAGLRLGFMISQEQNIEYLSKSRSLVESNTLSMKIAEYFLDNPGLRDQHVNEVKEGSAFIQSELDGMGLKWFGGQYTNGILIFLKTKSESDAVVSYLRDRKIYIRGSFEPPFEATIRVSIGPQKAMQAFITEFKGWLANR